MSLDEFDFNKDLLREIAIKKKDIESNIAMTQGVIKQARDNYNSSATYEVYKL